MAKPMATRLIEFNITPEQLRTEVANWLLNPDKPELISICLCTTLNNRRAWDINFNMVWAHNQFLHISITDGDITHRLLEIPTLDNSLEFYKGIFYKLPQLWQDFKKKYDI